MFFSADFYLLRSPRFPLAKLFLLNSEIDKGNLIGIKACFNNPVFLQSIYFSSRQFYHRTIDWLKRDSTVFDVEDKIFLSLYKYYVRICTRSTPYGMFAGFSFGNISRERSELNFSDIQFQPNFRVDIQAIRHLKEAFIKENLDVKLYPNTTLYPIGSRLRYVEEKKDLKYEISEIGNSPIIDEILEASSEGIGFKELITIVVDRVPEASIAEIEQFLQSLLENRVLIFNEPPYLLTCSGGNEDLLDCSFVNQIHQSAQCKLKLLRDRLEKAVDLQLIEELSNDLMQAEGDDSQLLQVDLKNVLSKNEISQQVVNKIREDVQELSGLMDIDNFKRLKDFRSRFLVRFEEQEISLCYAIDPELGIGYDTQISGNVETTPLLESIYFSADRKSDLVTIPPLLKQVLDKYHDCLSPSSGKVVALTKDDITEVSKPIEEAFLPDSAYMVGNIVSRSLCDLDQGNFKFLAVSSLPIAHANRILSRFSHYDHAIHERIKNALRRDNCEYLDVEICHDPGDRSANIMRRNNLYDYQIPYVGSIDSKIKRINIKDIQVSVRGSQILLRSKKLNKYIKPHLSSTYNYSRHKLSLFRFLCDLQNYNTYLGYKWNWAFMQDNSYLPRVEYKNLILSEARWKIYRNKDHTIDSLRETFAENYVPRFCNIKDGDNVLLLDLENKASFQLLLSKVRKSNIYLFECVNIISEDENLNMGLGYCTEFILPIFKEKTNSIQVSPKVNLDQSIPSKRRSFLPGDEWTYFKIYCSCSQGDRILKMLYQYMEENFSDDIEEPLFFVIRFSDPHHHIRFRIRNVELNTVIEQINRLFKPDLESGLITSIQLDTYHRELERYGKHNIDFSERLFYLDSKAVMAFLKELPRPRAEKLRWQISIVSIDMLLDDFNIAISDRVDLFRGSYQTFEKEFINQKSVNQKKAFIQTINNKLRQEREFLNSVLYLKKYGELEKLVLPFKKRSASMISLSHKISNNFENLAEFHDVIRSYVHMNLNRIFPTKARMHELVIYYFLYQMYNSIEKRNAGNKS